MAIYRTQAWVTSVLNEESAAGALVLANSLRRSMTTCRIVAITSPDVSLETRRVLQQSFDLVLMLDDAFMPAKSIKCDRNEAHAKAYVFALIPFEKCVFISANSMILENVDELFEAKFTFMSRMDPETGLPDLSVFMIQTERDLWQLIWKSVHGNEQKMTENFLAVWLKNQGAAITMGAMPDKIVADFSITSGKLIGTRARASIIHFVEELKNEPIILNDQIKLLNSKTELGILEQRITDLWIELYRKTTSKPSLEIENLASCLLKQAEYRKEPIAIVGMSCRFPGVNNVQEFWDMLYAGEEGIREPPAFRWTKRHTIRVSGQDRKTQAGFLAAPVDQFDARFFGVSPMEAAYMDPQTRIMHEVLWESLEDAGINPLSLYGTHAGIFTGSWMNDYKDIVTHSTERDFFRTYMGNSIGAAAARLSFLLGLTGPSIATESGCSSAIVAVDLAVKSLRAGETNLAMVGAVNLLLHPFNSDMMEYVISSDGRCNTFDVKANGFGRAEGCGVLVLKRLGDALCDRDNIWATIRGSAVSQEGASRSLGTPTVHCEALAMKLAMKDANLVPERVSFVETHGTGTQVGDPMEVAAIAKAYGSKNRKEPLVIGSVKTNVGHTESCSGITGIMKAVLAMQHEIIPKHRNLETLNPEIFLDSIPAIIPRENLPWPKVSGQPRICGVSSFGITGTDGHVILEEAPNNCIPKFSLGMERPTHLMTISAKTSEALDELLNEYENRFAGKEGDYDNPTELANMAYTANVGRDAFNHRTFLVARTFTNAAKILKEKKLLQREVKEGRSPQLCFLFTGQGSQYQGMAKRIYDTSPVFRIHFDHCDKELRTNYGISIKKALWQSEAGSKELSRTIYSQTSIFCVEYCLLKLWQSWGIQPDFVLGHSLGEFCAAVAAGLLDFEDALKLVAERSRLIDNLPRGSMLVIKASKPEVDKMMKDAKIELDFAAVNHPEQTAVAGDTSTVEQFLAYLKEQDVKAIMLEATHAFHSRHMNPMLEQYRQVVQAITFKRGNSNIQYVSGMEGRIIEDIPAEMGADYWVRHTREKVNFIDACRALKESGCQDFLEMGPQPVLSTFVMTNNEGSSINCLPSMRRGQDDWETILTSLGKLFLLGYSIDWKEYDEPYIRKKVSLPFHPFHRKPFWVESSPDTSTTIHPLIGHSMKNASAFNIFQNDLTVKAVPYLKDHCIGSRIVFPGAGYTEMCLSAGYCVANGVDTDTIEQPTRPMRLENVRIDAPLELKEGKSCRLQVLVDLPEKSEKQEEEEASSSGFRVKVFHQNDNNSEESGKWVLHASSTFIPVASTKECLSRWDPSRIAEIMSETQPISSDSFYKRVDEQGLKFGESFRTIRRYWTQKQEGCKEDTDEVVTEIALPSDWNKYLLHPLIIDSVFQTGILTRSNYETNKLKVPVRIGALTLLCGVTEENDGVEDRPCLYMHVRTDDQGVRHLFLCTPSLSPIAFVEDVELLETNVRAIESVLEQQSSAVPDAWEESWKVIASPFNTSLQHPVELDKIGMKPYVPQLGEQEHYAQVKRLLYLYMVEALRELGWQPVLGSTLSADSVRRELGIQESFHPLIHFYLGEIGKEGQLLRREQPHDVAQWRVIGQPMEAQWEIQGLAASLKAAPVVGSTVLVYEHLAQSLPKILRGELSALQLLFPLEIEKQQFSAEGYYQNHPSREGGVQVVVSQAKLMFQQLWDENGARDADKICRLLEVGAGTGALSLFLIELISECWGSRFEYYFTDISQSFFVKAEKRLEDYREVIKFVVFNIEESPLSQGIPLEYFDFVCCTDVLHATRNLEETLIHLRQTLKPGGILIFTETIIPARDTTFVFGLLEGYWRMEDTETRPEHCCVSERVWRELLEKTGFGRVSVEKIYMGQFACITAAASDDERCLQLVSPTRWRLDTSRPEWLVLSDVADVDLICGPVARQLHGSGFKVKLLLREEKEGRGEKRATETDAMSVRHVCAQDLEEELKRALEEGETSSLPLQGIIYGWGLRQLQEREQRNVARPLLHVAKALVSMTRPPQLFVLTQGVHPVTEDLTTENPSAATLFGMAKSLKNETSNMFVRAVDLDARATPGQLVAQVLYELAMSKTAKESNRLQVAYRHGVRYEPRLVKAALPKAGEALKLPPSTDRYQLKLPASRVIQDLEFAPLEEEEKSLGEREVHVKVKAYALNFRDIFAILKPSAEFDNLNGVGLDFSGVVTKAGQDARWKVGERVFGANFKDGQLPSHLNIDSMAVLRVPEGMTFGEAATLPAVCLTAYHCLINVAKMRKEDIVLIHTASGGVGLAAIQLAKHVGATIIATAGNPRKRAYLRGLGIQHVFHSRDLSYEQDIFRVTHGRGVDLVLNSITGPGVKEATLRATARNGRFIEMSKLNVWTLEEVTQLRPDVQYQIVDLTVLDRHTNEQLLKSMQKYLQDGVLKPIPYVNFDALHIRQALQYFQKAKHIGKVVVTMPEVSTQARQFLTKSPLFNADSSYLITGGLGGIGFEVCKWMLNLGATDIVLMGRSAPKPEIEKQIQKLNANGAKVFPRLGDVAIFDQVKQITEEIFEGMKPLRGVMHCAGVLKNNLYANQTWADFEATYRPKVQGTWNLHELTKSCPLEHFVVYSSLTALVGMPGQPNHSSANCFEDAFIHYRHSFGLPGTSINWGHWTQVGCAKDTNLSGVLPVSVQRMLNGLEIALKLQKRQVCFSDFDSLVNFSMFCPMIKSYLDDRLWREYTGSSSTNSQAPVYADQFWKEMDAVVTPQEKTRVMLGYMKPILRAALRLDPHDTVGDDANFQELGVDSLMMIELKNSIQSLLGTRLTVTTSDFKNCNTTRLLANAVVSKLMMDDSGEEETYPLEALPASELHALLTQDAVLSETVNPEADATGPVKPSHIKTLLVTGATGQVAPYLLSELTRNYPSVEKIYCLVRGSDLKVAQDFLNSVLDGYKNLDINRDKLEVVVGNVVQEKLSLSFEKYEKLAKSVDAILHCSAKTKNPFEHIRALPTKHQTDIRSVNLYGTLNILKFACIGKIKHVYFPSTLVCGVFEESVQGSLGDSWTGTSVIESIVQYQLPGLQTSKWIGEMLMNQANERGIPCKVFRFPWVGGNSQTGQVDPLRSLYILRYLSFLKMGALPDVVIPANILPVDVVAELSLRLFMSDETPNEIFNIAHPSPDVEHEFMKIAQEEFGKNLDVLDGQQLAERVKEPTGDNNKELAALYNHQKYLSTVLGDGARFVTGYMNAPDTFFTNVKVSRYIPNYGQNFPRTMDVVLRDLRYLKQNNLTLNII